MDSIGLGDLLAVMNSRDNDGIFGGSGIMFIVLFLIFAIFSGRGFLGFNGGDAAAQGALTRAELYDSLNYNQLENGVRGIQQGLCDGFYAQNTTALQGFNGVGRDLCQGFNGVNTNLNNGFNSTNMAINNVGYQMQDCCCETNRNIDAVRAENYKNTCEITNAIHAEGEQTRALINANTMQDLRDRLEARDRDLLTANFQLSQQAQSANLISTLRPFPSPAYITCSPYQAAYANTTCGAPVCSCGC